MTEASSTGSGREVTEVVGLWKSERRRSQIITPSKRSTRSESLALSEVEGNLDEPREVSRSLRGRNNNRPLGSLP